MIKRKYLSGLLLLCIACGSNDDSLFEILDSKKTGIVFQNSLRESATVNILDYLYFYNGGGVAIGDINNDGLQDIYFSGNQVNNALYLNKGNLEFEDITVKAGVAGESDWNTGVSMADINGDGLLDIYVCAVVGVNGFDGHNELFINNGDNTFTEQSEKYGLNFDNYSSNAAFLDYDLDGDLDLYLLNHAIHNETSFGNADIRNNRTYESGDKLMRNDGATFTDVSKEAGIYGGANGYGLGIAIADFNVDGYPDIYVGNDFHEDDYYYLNNGNGTFSENLKAYFGHTSRFSMGNDVADINHDGFPDIISLDMLPEDEAILKASAGDDKMSMMKLRIERLGYHYQFSRNMLQINNNGKSFTETALLSGVAATDWSWSALFNDYDQDGEQDLFIANGIPKRPNDLDYVNFTSSEQIRNKLGNTKLIDTKALEMMPSGYINNKIFKGEGSLKFQDKSGLWISNDSTISNGAAYADIDNDGDLDIITNNLNATPTLYLNNTNEKRSYLKIKLAYTKKNSFGIGTKMIAYLNGNAQHKELYTVRGFQSSSEPLVHFGFGNATHIDSLKIIWPNKKEQLLLNLTLNQQITLNYNLSETKDAASHTKTKKIHFQKEKSALGLNFKHEENEYVDFDFQKLIPFQVSDRGPAIAVGDLNNDGKEDVYVGGASRTAPQVYLQTDTMFIKKVALSGLADKIFEDINASIQDFNKDGYQDLIVTSGGGQFRGKTNAVLDRLYTYKANDLVPDEFPKHYSNSSALAAADYNNDDFIDLFIGSASTPQEYGKINPSFLFKNNKGVFETQKVEALEELGIVTDAIFTDFNNDNALDLIVVGEWMTPKFLQNKGGNFVDVTKELTSNKNKGLWQSIIEFDIDNDGDMDYLLGNWGLNSKFFASEKAPLKMYYGDFDNNGATETILAINKNGAYYPLADLDALSGQLVSLTKKRFPTYREFAGKTLDQVFDQKTLSTGVLFEVNTLSSGYLKNENGKFVFNPFENSLQTAPILKFLVADFDNDSQQEVLMAGNYFGVIPFHGRFDGFPGALLKSENNILLGTEIGLDFTQKSIRGLNIIHIKSKKYLLVTPNNDEAQLYEIQN